MHAAACPSSIGDRLVPLASGPLTREESFMPLQVGNVFDQLAEQSRSCIRGEWRVG